MDYSSLVAVYQKLESTTKRLKKTKILADFLKEINGEDLTQIMLLIQGRIFPNWDDRKIGVASRLVVKAINKAAGISTDKIEREWKKTGDLGVTAQNLMGKKSQVTLFSQSLTITKVFTNLRKLASLEGQGSVDRKIDLIAELLNSAQPQEARYIIRTILEDLRVGIGEGSLRDAIIWAFFEGKVHVTYTEETDTIEIGNREEYNTYVNAIQQAYDIKNDFAAVAEIAQKQGVEGLSNVGLEVGKPVKVMLALKVNNAEEGLERVGKPAEVEYKLDGFRMQIHKHGTTIKLYTRRLEEVTVQFADVVNYVREGVTADTCILDSEVVGYSPKTKKYLPFQSISQRIRRKYDIEEMSKNFPVELNVFDILSYNGENLLKEPFKKRRELLEGMIHEKEKQIVLVKKIITDDAERIKEFFKESIKAGNEGLMLKSLESPYKPGARVGYMVKLKETMENLDLVIIAAEWGEGKRANWLSSFTLACRSENGELLEIGKVSTGLKEKEEEGLTFQQMTEQLKPLIISEKGREVKVKPEVVLEVAYEEIQKSPTYASGFALRFPRVIRLRSEERGVEDISTLDYVEELYYNQ